MCKRQTSKKIFAFTFAHCEWALSVKQVIFVECQLLTTNCLLRCYSALIEMGNGFFSAFSYLKQFQFCHCEFVKFQNAYKRGTWYFCETWRLQNFFCSGFYECVRLLNEYGFVVKYTLQNTRIFLKPIKEQI